MNWENNRLPINVGHSIGNGAFGQVSQASDLLGNDLAIKNIAYSSKREAHQAISEGINLKKLAHENVVKVHHVSLKEPNSVSIATEMCDQGDLDSYFENNLISTQMTKGILMEVAHGLKYIHSQGYVHRDIKPHNIFMKGNKPKIGDLGLAYRALNGFTQKAGTPIFMAKETLTNNLCSFQTDIWSFGLTVYWLLVGQDRYFEFAENYDNNVIKDKLSSRLSFPPHVNRQWKIFIKKCIHSDTLTRFKNMNEVTHSLSSIPSNNWLYHKSLQAWENFSIRDGRKYEASLNGPHLNILNKPIGQGNTITICNQRFSSKEEAIKYLYDFFVNKP